MNKKIIAFVTIATMIAVPAMSYADAAPSAGDTSSTASAASTGGSSSTAAPSAGGSSSTAAPSAGGASSTAAPSAGPTTSTAAPTAGPTTSTAAPSAGGSSSSAGSSSSNNGGGSTGGSSSSSGGSISSSGSYIGGGFSAVPLAVAPASNGVATTCPLITATILKQGIANDANQVMRLQTFLKGFEHLDVAVTGTYDQATVQAVQAFQRKYMSEILGPWGATKPSGVAYITTIKKVNQLSCAQPLTLDPKEIAVIDSYKNAVQAGQPAPAGVQVGVNTVAPAPSSSSAPVVGPTVVGQSQPQSQAQTAAAGNASIWQRFWSFIVGLFHR
ncbi:MAG: peptidoglycan-binding protein [Patescibacteria group bacterium]|nr:peptidoglycan-binding protein [Patescibacteria group bacterium]